MTDLSTPTAGTRKQNQLTDLGAGAHMCWYPVAVASDITPGTVVGADLGDGRIVIWRGEDGVVRVMSAYCKHMGADLSAGGDVIGNDIRCPFHHWAYGDGGRCTDIPSGDAVPKGARLATFPTEEKWGLIWIFLGEEPLYDLPTFAMWDDDKFVFRAFEAEFNEKLMVEPWVFTSNIFDIVHNRVVHGLKIKDPVIQEVNSYCKRMVWDAEHTGERETGKVRSDITVYGCNAISTHGEVDGRPTMHIAASMPGGRMGTRMFFSVATTKGPGDQQHLDRKQTMHNRFVNEDLPILNGMRFGDLQMVGADSAMTRFMRFAREYPRTSVEALEAAAIAAAKKQKAVAVAETH